MKKMKLKELTRQYDEKIYNMLQRIGKCEYQFKNNANGLKREEYLYWLNEQCDWAKGEKLPENYVPQTIFIMFANELPVGIGKIRHRLTEISRECGGNIGVAVDPIFRGKGYGKILLELLLIEAKKINVEEIIITVEKSNIASRIMTESVIGEFTRENGKWWIWEKNIGI